MNERISEFLRNPWTIPVVVGITSFGSGFGLGYVFNQRRSGRVKIYGVPDGDSLDLAPDELEEVEEPRVRPKPVVVDEKYLSNKDGVGLDTEVVVEGESSGGPKEEILEQIPQPEVESEIVEENIFANNGDDWDYEEELAKRTPNEPYVLHKDEFFEKEEAYQDYLQHTLTYYAGDNILADEDQKPVYDKRLVGDLEFGHGSGDPNVVYIRNERQKAEYEVFLDQGHYAVEVLGGDDDDRQFQHSATPRRIRD